MKLIQLKKTLKLAAFLMVISVVILAILFVLLSLIILFSNFSPTLINKLTALFGGIGIFFTTYVSARILHQKGIIIGLICGLALSLVIFLTSFLATGVIFSITEFIKIVIVTLSACLGGILGANSRK